jgi:hypothetical protein
MNWIEHTLKHRIEAYQALPTPAASPKRQLKVHSRVTAGDCGAAAFETLQFIYLLAFQHIIGAVSNPLSHGSWTQFARRACCFQNVTAVA